MQIHDLKSPKGSRKGKRIVGRGQGSGSGQTSGRGENGQRSRRGRWSVGGSEGGQMPLIRRLPKVGFRSHRPILNQVVNLSDLEKYEKGTVVDVDFLKKENLIGSRRKPFKILGKGEIKNALVVKGGAISTAAKEKIEKAGGTVESDESKKGKIFDKSAKSKVKTTKTEKE